MITFTQAVPTPVGPAQWQRQAARVLDELKGAACLSLIFAVMLSLAGVRNGDWQWLCLVGGPAWLGLRVMRLL